MHINELGLYHIHLQYNGYRWDLETVPHDPRHIEPHFVKILFIQFL